MGSSKKHKEKDKDKERERRREKDRKHREKDGKDRDRDSDKEKRRKDDRSREKRSHVSDEEFDRVEKKKAKKEEYDDLYEYAVEESARDDYSNGHEVPHRKEGGEVSLSIEETNKLRIKLGLKPLEVPDSSLEKGEKSTSLKEDVHVPAINMSDQKEAENFKRKLEEMKEKRRINKKLGKVKTLGAEDSDEDDSAASWVAKSRKKEHEKILADKRAQLLSEMDEEFGISDLVEEEFGSLSRTRQPAYSSQDLRGLKVEHSQEQFLEGNTVIMTLKDASVLDDDEETLVNVNIVDKEKGEKNIELRKRKPDYRPYDEPEMDECGMVKPQGLLQKYDEEIEGEQKQSFVLGSGGEYDTTKEDEVKKIQAKLRAQMVSLEMASPQLVAEYYTQEEMVKFKKPKKTRRKIKKRETLKADDLEALPGQADLNSDRGSRSVKSILKNAPRKHEQGADDDMMELAPLEPEDEELLVADTENAAIVEEDEAQLELQLALQRSRRLKQKKETVGAERVLEALATVVKQEKEEDNGNKDSIILNSTSEFCRTLGEIPTLSTPVEQMEEDEDDNEWRMDVERDDEAEPQGGWEWVKTQEEKMKREREEETENSILEAEPLVGKGVGAALFLASKKGLLEQSSKAKTEGKVIPTLPSVGVVDEEKMREEERERGGRPSRDFDRDRDRYGGSSKSKQEYKPDVKLEYYDDNGRSLTPKEAFRYLSHKFHGKASGKMKSEKRNKKRQDEVALQKMNSGDTPLNTTALLIEKQKNAQSPYVILSGGGQTFSTGTTISKRK